MKLFMYKKAPTVLRIGIEYQGKKFDFSRIWTFFKDIRGERKLPDLLFLQVMVEFEMFTRKNIQDIITTVTNLRKLDDVELTEPLEYDLPISRPQKIICLGRNYKKHAEEFKNEVPPEPIIFAKLPSSLLPHEGVIRLPRGVGRVDHEIELAVVIGKSGKKIPRQEAMNYVAGYTVLNDVTARELQIKDIEGKKPWMRSKSFDTFCPLGPFLVPADEISDPHNLEIKLFVNGEIRQQANTSEMVYQIPEIIEYISRHITLNAGDIIATGTPAGVSELKPGDVVVGEISQIGTLRNTVDWE